MNSTQIEKTSQQISLMVLYSGEKQGESMQSLAKKINYQNTGKVKETRNLSLVEKYTGDKHIQKHQKHYYLYVLEVI